MIRRILPFFAVVAVLSLPARAEAQRFGPQLSWGDDSDLGLGVRAEWDVGSWFTGADPDMPVQLTRTRVATSFDWFFPGCDDGNGVDCSADYWEINGNLLVPVTVGSVDPYVGLGLNVARMSVEVGTADASDTEVGLNLLGGLNFLLGSYSSYVEARFELDGGEQFVLTWGFLLGAVE